MLKVSVQLGIYILSTFYHVNGVPFNAIYPWSLMCTDIVTFHVKGNVKRYDKILRPLQSIVF